MSKVLIVAKTRMRNEKVCVGGIDLDKLMSVRLLDRNGFHESKWDCPYEIRDIWDIEYSHNPRPLPHSEDVRVIQRIKDGTLKQEFSILDILRKINFKIYAGHIRETFEGKLDCINSKVLFISKENVPQNSTCFWICDREIQRSDYINKIRYNYNDEINWGYNVSYVGLKEDPEQIIPENTLIRLSLADWWSPPDLQVEERCYLQLSGWY
jgi:hypothetical protein